MKSEVIEEENLEFPRLMKEKDSDEIVMFYKSTVGITIHKGSAGGKLGFIFDGWDMSNFEDFNGKVILSNN